MSNEVKEKFLEELEKMLPEQAKLFLLIDDVGGKIHKFFKNNEMEVMSTTRAFYMIISVLIDTFTKDYKAALEEIASIIAEKHDFQNKDLH